MPLFIVISVFVLDRITKFFVSRDLSVNSSVPVIKNVFHLTLVHNRGAAFGILKNQIPLFIFTAIAAIIMIYFHLRKNNKFLECSLYAVSLSLILGGAIGNLIDRIFLGYVIDFLDFRFWPVFNIADSAISIGGILLAYSIFRQPEKKTIISSRHHTTR